MEKIKSRGSRKANFSKVENLTQNNLISLKEASSLSGYSADYIGQLIRGGKIPGKQVYCNVQWMTTVDAVMKYKKNGKSQKSGALSNRLRKIQMEFGIIKLFFSTFKSALPIMLVIIISFVILASFLLFNFFSSENIEVQINEGVNTEALTF